VDNPAPRGMGDGVRTPGCVQLVDHTADVKFGGIGRDTKPIPNLHPGLGGIRLVFGGVEQLCAAARLELNPDQIARLTAVSIDAATSPAML
jgi:hypothetical protein